MNTESQLNSLNKTNLVELALKLQEEVSGFKSGPVTPDVIKQEYLSLKKQSIDIAAKREERAQIFETQKIELRNKLDKELKELELKYDSTDGVDAKELTKAYEELQKKAVKAEADLSFGLEAAQNKANIEIASINERADKVQEEYDNLVADLKIKTTKVKNDYVEEIESIKKTHGRTVEQIEYEQSKAIRDLNEKFIDDAAAALNKSVVVTSELEELVNFKATDSKDVESKIAEAVKSAKSEVYASEGAKFSQLKSSTDSTIALLNNDKSHLTATVNAQNTRIADLEARLKDVPNQIATAVASARSEVTVNQDANKK